MGDNVIIGTGKSIGMRYWSPADFVTNGWWDAQDYSTITESGTVSQWDDKSGNANHAAQANAGLQPFYTAVDPLLNNKPSLNNIGSHRYLRPPAQIQCQRVYAITYYEDGIVGAWDSHQSFLGKFGVGTRITGRTGQDNWDTQGGATNFNYQSDIYKDGGTTDQTADALPMPMTMWKFESTVLHNQFWEILSNGPNYTNWDGGIGELIMTDGTEDLATQQKVEGYLAHKWGVTLAVGHPYEFGAPVL